MKNKNDKAIIEKIKNAFRSDNDPLGSYTGVTPDGSAPTQDADDL